jgi:glutamate--cysteine ligase
MGDMASAVTARPGSIRAGSGCDGVLTSSSSAALHIAGASFVDGVVGRVGIELEAHCFDLTDPLRRPEWSELVDLIGSMPALPGGSVVTVEPGGAVELSGPPACGPVPAIAAMAADRKILKTHFAAAGLGLALLGADPLRMPRRVNPGARYQAMEKFFRATNTGVAGAAMMTSTASIQINLDAGPRDGWAERVRLAHALGPTMIAIAANSPLLAGRFTGWVSSRQRVWGQLDSARCGPILGASGDDPCTDWARYALKAPVMLVHAPEPTPVQAYTPFADWADGLVLLDDRRPTTTDLDYHLTTLFPPVRPRRWLEIRYLDSVPDEIWPALVFLLVTLFDDPVVADIASDAVAPVAKAWDLAARVGLADGRLYAAANRCLAAVAGRVPVELADAFAVLVQNVERGRCPSDDFADLVVRQGIAPALIQSARDVS